MIIDKIEITNPVGEDIERFKCEIFASPDRQLVAFGNSDVEAIGKTVLLYEKTYGVPRITRIDSRL